jgi:glyoxylase-like metal-dependent hydrolase (beta-lactamase superfamily II)
MMRAQVILVISIATLGVFAATVGAQPIAAAAPDREIRQISGDLYDAREGQQHTVFLVTPAGIIMGDPLNVAFAQWLNDRFAERFPNLAVRYVLLTHHHFDRADGGGVFTNAERVGHEAYNRALSNARSEWPSFVGVQDRNDNRRFVSAEVQGPDGALVLSRDRNGDGIVTLDELWRFVVSARTTYHRRLTIALGGKQLELVHPGEWHSPDMTVLFFPNERVLFAVDPPPLQTLPFSFGTAKPRQVYDWLHAVAPLDFDTLMFGDGTTMRHSDVNALTGYLDEIRTEVADRYEDGQSVEEIQASALGENYVGTPHYRGRQQQIADIYRTVQLRRVTVSGAGTGNYSRVHSSFCSSYQSCTAGGVVPAGTADLSLWLGRRLAVGATVVLPAQTWSTRRQPLHEEELALRQTRGALLLRIVPTNVFALSLGPSVTYGDAEGIDIVRGRLVPVGGQHRIHERAYRFGLSFGAEARVPLTEKLTLVAPVQTFHVFGTLPESWPNRLDVVAGVGVSVRLVRHVN